MILLRKIGPDLAIVPLITRILYCIDAQRIISVKYGKILVPCENEGHPGYKTIVKSQSVTNCSQLH